MAATRGPPIHGCDRSRNENGLVSGFQYGFGRCRLRVGGSTRWCRQSATLMIDATPAAAFEWPIDDLIDPSTHAPGAMPRSPNTRSIDWSSVRSPTTVPVPCASISPTDSGGTPARAQARSSARICPSRRGAVNPRLLPSLEPAIPLTTA